MSFENPRKGYNWLYVLTAVALPIYGEEKSIIPLEHSVPPKAQIERLVKITGDTAHDRDMKPGFLFLPDDYSVLKDFRKESDSAGCTAPRCVRRFLTLSNEETQVEIMISVNSDSVRAARDEFIAYIIRSTMRPPEVYAPGPAGYGDFCILLASDAAANKIDQLIHFMRANVGMTIELTRGRFDVSNLARRIDAKIMAENWVMDLDRLCPQGIRGTLSKQEIRVGETWNSMWISTGGRAKHMKYLCELILIF